MNTRQKRVQRLEANHDTTHKSAAEMTDAELMRIAGVGPDVTNEELERIARGEAADAMAWPDSAPRTVPGFHGSMACITKAS